MSKKDFLISFHGACHISPNVADNILSIKQKISQKIGLKTDQMALISDGKTLPNDSSINDFYKDGKLQFIISINKNWKGVNIKFDQSKRALKIQTNENILGLKSKIQKAMGYEIGRQLLYYHGNTVTDNQRIDEMVIYAYSYFDLRLVDQIQIFVKYENGRHFSMDIQNNEMIRNVKLMIEKRENLNFQEFSLIFRGKILQNDQPVDEYGITNQSEIHLVCKLKGIVQLLIKTMKEETISIKIHSSETVKNMKLIILGKSKLYPEQQKLLFLGSILEDDKRIDEYPIKDGSVLNLIEILNSGMTIFVERFDCGSILITVYKKMEIAVVKEILEGIIGINRNEQKLFFNYIALEDEQTFDQIPIKEYFIIELRLKDRILIFGRISGAETVTMEICKNEKVSNVKKEIENETGLNVDHQRLTFNNRELKDGELTVDKCGIGDYAMIHVDFAIRQGVQIIVREGRKTILGLNLRKSENILAIKKRIEEHTNIDPRDQVLSWNSKILEDDKALAEYGIKDRTAIFVDVKWLIMRIFVHYICSYTTRYSFALYRNSKIRELKKQVSEKMGISNCDFELAFLGMLLEEDKTFIEYGIDEGSEMHAIDNLRGGGRGITAETLDGKGAHIPVSGTETVGELRKLIQNKIGLCTDGHRLVFGDLTLEDAKTLEEYGITGGEVINVEPINIPLAIASADAILLSLTTMTGSTISDIKKEIHDTLGIGYDIQTLMRDGSAIDDGMAIDNNVYDCIVIDSAISCIIKHAVIDI